MNQPDNPLSCIKRTEPGDGAGSSGVWIVTVVRAQIRCSARFRDTAYPAPAVALQAAQAFRDAVQARLPNRRIGLLDSASAGEMAFVRLAVFGGKASWMIRMTIGGKLRAKLFSVRKYGADEARRRALELRPQWLSEAGLDAQPLPTKNDIARIERQVRLDFGVWRHCWRSIPIRQG